MASLQFLRRTIGRRTGDLDILEATASGTTDTLIDALNAPLETNTWRGRLGYFSGGTVANLYRTVRVTGNDKSTQTVTFTPAAPSNTAAGDTLELYNKDGQGPTVRHIHDTINYCIESVSKGVLTEAVSTPVAFSSDSPVLTIPGTWRRLTAVEIYVDEEWEVVSEADWTETVDRQAYTVRLDNYPRYRADNNTVRLRGGIAAGQLTADTDTTLVDTEWLVNQAVAYILMDLATAEKVPDRRAADYRATAQFIGAQANAMRTKVPSTISGYAGVILGGAG